MEASMYDQPQVSTIPREMFIDDEEDVDDYIFRKHNCLKRDSGTSQTQGSLDSEDYEEIVTKKDGSVRIATEIQQGEQLLQRLQQVQLRQDVCTPESPCTSKTVVQETGGETEGELGDEEDYMKAREDDLPGGVETKENRFDPVEHQGAKMMKKQINESKYVKAGMSSYTMVVEYNANSGDSDDDPSYSCVHEDKSPIDPIETSTEIPFLSPCHRLSVDEPLLERQIFEEAKEKQNLQRSGGLLYLTDNPDVLEFPFKTNILLEPFEPTKDGPDQQRSDWQFSEQKMKKEISQEFQRELVLVNQGKIPGGYSKEETRQLKETKLLFEAFQHDNTEGPRKHRKPPTSPTKGHVYPSVLERTRSMRLLSLNSCPVSRSLSLRLLQDIEKSPDISRSLSSTGGSLDKKCFWSFTKQDLKASQYRSMDSINKDVFTCDVGARSKTLDGNTKQESPILKHNPFFKLRPALALKPEVLKEIREAKEREEELRRQRCTLYGENGKSNKDEEKSRFETMLAPAELRAATKQCSQPRSVSLCSTMLLFSCYQETVQSETGTSLAAAVQEI
ncbi:uncharacterized protein LOC117546177 [Gymnodraco acuticeps]|uniref:Uncharacterized protein LOC117546177 n=1 Tax=Gymnodraco acuticeps TaxID=8218 RepID=A0A6P8U617_GYMAC|nr:uncharacterized protein LOC117546177 [Gymnodraco acuticeps]